VNEVKKLMKTRNYRMLKKVVVLPTYLMQGKETARPTSMVMNIFTWKRRVLHLLFYGPLWQPLCSQN